MTGTPETHAHNPLLGKRGAFEGVARRHRRRRNPAQRPPRSSLRPPTNPPRHSPQRWVEKVGRSIKGSETPQKRAPHPKQPRGRARNGDLLTYPWVGESNHGDAVFEDTGPSRTRRCSPRGHCRSGAQPVPERQKPPAQPGLRVRATLRCPKAKRSQAVKGGPSGPSAGSREAAPLTAWGAELRAYGLAYAFAVGPDGRILSNGRAPRAC